MRSRIQKTATHTAIIGETKPGERAAAFVAVAPTPVLCRRRVDRDAALQYLVTACPQHRQKREADQHLHQGESSASPDRHCGVLFRPG